MAARLIVDIPSINWACTYLLDEEKVQSAGRGKHNAIEVPDMGASDRHMEFYFSRGNWFVRDLGGEGGLKVNGRIVQESALEDGAEIRIGNSQLSFELEDEVFSEDWQGTAEVVQNASARVRDLLPDEPVERSASSTATVAAGPKILPPLKKFSDSAEDLDDSADDLLWVSEHMATLLEDVLSKPASLDFVLQRMMMVLRRAIGADYGFLMLPDNRSQRWMIRTQVGNAFTWTGYERAHPVPLTVANAAFEKMRVVSNAIADDDSIEDVVPSESMLALNVNGYIAVPLVKGEACRGVLYFDTRDAAKEFRARDVKLLQQAGTTIVEIEDRKLEKNAK